MEKAERESIMGMLLWMDLPFCAIKGCEWQAKIAELEPSLQDAITTST